MNYERSMMRECARPGRQRDSAGVHAGSLRDRPQALPVFVGCDARMMDDASGDPRGRINHTGFDCRAYSVDGLPREGPPDHREGACRIPGRRWISCRDCAAGLVARPALPRCACPGNEDTQSEHHSASIRCPHSGQTPEMLPVRSYSQWMHNPRRRRRFRTTGGRTGKITTGSRTKKARCSGILTTQAPGPKCRNSGQNAQGVYTGDRITWGSPYHGRVPGVVPGGGGLGFAQSKPCSR